MVHVVLSDLGKGPKGHLQPHLKDWQTVPNALTALRLVAVPGILGTWYLGTPSRYQASRDISSVTFRLKAFSAGR